jgi:hypothetical protein
MVLAELALSHDEFSLIADCVVSFGGRRINPTAPNACAGLVNELVALLCEKVAPYNLHVALICAVPTLNCSISWDRCEPNSHFDTLRAASLVQYALD